MKNLSRIWFSLGWSIPAVLRLRSALERKQTSFTGPPQVTHIFLIVYSCVGLCGFLLAKILREYYRVRTVFGIIGAWMAAALSLTLPMHMALDTTYHVLIVIGMFIMTMVPFASVAVCNVTL
ncbi:hypothetical protein CTI12_AA104340 [Artemisia annua]|uniref:Uncharacterized protein n=1 Tax=Artemisia annua TaxID=35608 RepID=A0A2U1PWG3_ARTAN|nr:hypothetical protein CTI12_AA104340 [Artemisia annua]